MKWKGLSVTIVFIAVVTLLVWKLLNTSAPVHQAAKAPPPTSYNEQEVTLEKCSADAITIWLVPLTNEPGKGEVELLELGGKSLAKASAAHDGKPFAVKLDAAVNTADLANYYIRYRTDAAEAFRQRSLQFLTEVLDTRVLGQREFLAGTSPVVRIIVCDRAADAPVENAHVSLCLLQGAKQICSAEAKTDAAGEVAATLHLPAEELTGAKLKVNVQSRTIGDAVEETVNVSSGVRTLLTTDKPLYQPGQTIHIRALVLRRPSMAPLAGADVRFEVEDGKGNKVFAQPVKADSFGVSHADFNLADELNQGTYRVRAIAAGIKEEKTVTVQRYVLPKFKTVFQTDRRFYRPGETVKAELQADYFFGKPVAGGKVQVRCSKFDVGSVEFQVIDGQTDAKGHYFFEVKLPASFVGQPLEAGNASARLEITVADAAGHKETITRNVPVAVSPITLAAVPESGELAPGLENRIYIVAQYADATPARCEVAWRNAPGGKPQVIRTDEAGFGFFSYQPTSLGNLTMSLAARDEKGQEGTASVEVAGKTAPGGDAILLRSDKSLYRVGEQAKLEILTTRRSGRVYLDVIKDHQTYLTRTLAIDKGRASDVVNFDADLAGTVQINAYLIGGNGQITRTRRLVIVDPADDLKVAIHNDAETYPPGGEAKLSFHVTGKSGQGVAAALGVAVVDEALFALQEMQPGLEKIYFYLEKEIAAPRYEIHGWSLDDAFRPEPAETGAANLANRRDTAARVLLASAPGGGDYSLDVDTDKNGSKNAARQTAFQNKMRPLLAGVLQKVSNALTQYAKKHGDAKIKTEYVTVETLIKEGLLRADDARDPWGKTVRLTGLQWCPDCKSFHSYAVASAGIDGHWKTPDDCESDYQVHKCTVEREVTALKVAPDAEMERPMEMPEGRAFSAPSPIVAFGNAARPDAAPIRVREHFPETLYFNPAVITDADGKADLRVPLADSITTWRLACMASSAHGQLGSATAGINVFQDFFVDIDFPVALTQNDEVSVPVVVYNYLKDKQDVRLEATADDWFELRAPREQKLTLAPGEVRAVHFPLVARKVGFQKFTVTARGASKSDAVARSVEIVPDGKEFLVSHSGRLEGKIAHTIDIPPGAIEGASKIFVKVYPGMLSQAVEGLDTMLRMPGGCFEQTSSTTYPNVLVLDYMKTSGKITPEIEMKAEGFINAGYQRLLSFEVSGGGFEWFGRPPGHSILTAYGLMEFYDMSKVHPVDPDVIARTQQWLARQQQPDGSFAPSTGGIAEGAINKMQDNLVRNTAYTVWALAGSENRGPELLKGVAYLRGRLDDIRDNYTLALAANALVTVDPADKATLRVLDVLRRNRAEKDGLVFWALQSDTPTFGTGEAGDIEVTALAAQALIRSGRELGIADKAVSYLAKNKDAFGTWYSTQATIQALRAMLLAERGATAKTSGTIALKLNGKAVKTLTIDASNRDVLQIVDLKELTAAGRNDVSLEFQGDGGMLYQIVGRYYLPYPRGATAAEPDALGIKVDYDRTNLAAEDVVGVTATVTNNREGTAQMVIVDLGLPPGFTPVLDQLNRLVAERHIEKYSVTGRQIIVYLRELTAGKPVKLQYQLLAKYPLKAQTGKSVAYQYYNPAARGEAKPVTLSVTEGRK